MGGCGGPVAPIANATEGSCADPAVVSELPSLGSLSSTASRSSGGAFGSGSRDESGWHPARSQIVEARKAWNRSRVVPRIANMTDSIAEEVEVVPEVYDSMAEVDERKFVRRIRRVASKVPFARHAVAMWHSMQDERTPIAAKGLILGALAYFMLPTDLIPDFLAGLGFTDDAAVMIATLKTISSYLKPEHYREAEVTLAGDA